MTYSIPSTFWLPTKIPGVFFSASVSCGFDGKEMSKSPDSIPWRRSESSGTWRMMIFLKCDPLQPPQ